MACSTDIKSIVEEWQYKLPAQLPVQPEANSQYNNLLEQCVVRCLQCWCCVCLQHLLPKVTKSLKGEELLVLYAVPCVNVAVDLAIARVEAV